MGQTDGHTDLTTLDNPFDVPFLNDNLRQEKPRLVFNSEILSLLKEKHKN